LKSESLICLNCIQVFKIEDHIIHLLPSKLDSCGRTEDEVWKNHEREGIEKPPWMALIHKRDEINYFLDQVLPDLSLKGVVLEIGAGSCWASSLIKYRFQECYVVATDISPHALRKGQQICNIIGASPDAFINCDIEHLPFAPGLFDVVIGNAILHHLTDLKRGLSFINRVLKPGGTLIINGEIACGKLFSFVLQSRIGLAGRRRKELGVNENAYSYQEWQKMLLDSHFKEIRLSFEKNWQYRLYHWFPPVYYKIIGGFPQYLLKFIPCGIRITAIK